MTTAMRIYFETTMNLKKKMKQTLIDAYSSPYVWNDFSYAYYY